MVKKSDRKRWRPTIFTDEIVKKLEDSFKVGSTVIQACTYAGISKQDYYNWIKKNDDFFDQMEQAQNFPYIFSKEAIFKAIGSKDIALSAKYALEFLKRRDPERKDKQENTISTDRFTSIKIEDATSYARQSKRKTNWKTTGTSNELSW